ncbi:MAG: hypothetical protein EBT52_09060, partial [Flavobacteriia bacterium]|nr:hypothetical protein [Flavobacteriia bacterium]
FCENLKIHHPQQIEFARLNLNYTVMSKRKMLRLVEEGHVDGWNDPRMPTLSGMRRRGFTPASIRSFCERVGLAKRENIIEMELLEFCPQPLQASPLQVRRFMLPPAVFTATASRSAGHRSLLISQKASGLARLLHEIIFAKKSHSLEPCEQDRTCRTSVQGNLMLIGITSTSLNHEQ